MMMHGLANFKKKEITKKRNNSIAESRALEPGNNVTGRRYSLHFMESEDSLAVRRIWAPNSDINQVSPIQIWAHVKLSTYLHAVPLSLVIFPAITKAGHKPRPKQLLTL